MTTQTTTDLVVVGAGLGGLVAAARAQQTGRSVVVLEQSSAPGGMGRSPLLAKVPVNLGPHALYLGGPCEAALQALGLPLDGFSPGGDAFVETAQGLVPMPTTPMGLLSASWLTWRERVELGLSLRAVLGRAPEGSCAKWLDGVRSLRVRAFLESTLRVTTYTNAPELLSARLAFAQLKRVLAPGARGVRYLDGGWQTLVDALAARVPVRFGARVSQVSADGVVTLESGEQLRGAEVALAVPLAAVAKWTGDERVQARLAAAQPVRVASLDLVLSALPEPRRRLALGLEAPLYFSVHSRPEVEAHVHLHAAWYLRPDDVSDAPTLERRLEDFLERVQPGWRALVEARRFFPHLRVMEDVPREERTILPAPLRLISSVATQAFLFDAVVEAGLPPPAQRAVAAET